MGVLFHVPAGDANATRVVIVRGGDEVASWTLEASEGIDLPVVDRLARLQVAAGRLGCSIRISDACARLRELIDLAGLALVLIGDVSVVEVGGEPESREEVSVEEGVNRRNPLA